jgi:hypothetical protein
MSDHAAPAAAPSPATSAASTCALSDEERAVSLLLRQHVWPSDAIAASAVQGPQMQGFSDADAAYLRDEVMPTLVPALHDLSEVVQREQDLGDGARASSRCVSRANPTGASGPLQWLAQYLYRNHHAKSDAVAAHPYNVLAHAAKSEASSKQ